MTEALPIYELVCTGKALTRSNKTSIVFELLDADRNSTGRELAYSFGKNFRQCRLGSVYSAPFETLTEGSAVIISNKLEWVRLWPNTADCIRWQEAWRSFEILERAKRQEKKQTGLRPALDAIRPMRQLLLKTDYLGRLALEVQVLNYLRGGAMIQKED